MHLSPVEPGPFCYLCRVRYSECDAQSIAFNTRYGEWVDLATTEFLRCLFGDVAAVDYRLVAQSMRWMAPAHFDDVLHLEPQVSHVGRTSFTVITSVLRDGAVLAEANTTYVRVKDGEKSPVSDTERVALVQGAPGVVVDHAMAMGRLVKQVSLADQPPVPWRNGGGRTQVLWMEGEGAPGFALRLSVARIEVDGPYSAWPGVQRAQGILEGEGLTLGRDWGPTRVTSALPVVFDGEEEVTCTLQDGPVLALNAMVARSEGRLAFRPIRPGRLRCRFAVARQPGRIGGRDFQVGDLAIVEGEIWSRVPVFAIDWLS